MKEINQHAKFQRAWLRDRLLIVAEGCFVILIGVGLVAGGAWIGMSMNGQRYSDGSQWIAWSIAGLMGVGGCLIGTVGRRQMDREARLGTFHHVPQSPFTELCSEVSLEFNEVTPWPEDRSSVLFNEGGFLDRTGEHQKAYDIFCKLGSEMPGNTVVEFWLAECLRKMGRFPEAVARYEQLKASHDWSGPVAAFFVFKCAEAMFEAEESVLALEKVGAVQFMAVDQLLKADFLDHLATTLAASPKRTAAPLGLGLARRAFDLNPRSVSIGATLAWFLVATSETGRAEELAKITLRESDSPTDQAMSALTLARINRTRDQAGEAEKLEAFARYAMPDGPLRRLVE